MLAVASTTLATRHSTAARFSETAEAAGSKPGVVNSGTAHVRNTVIAGNRSGSALTSADVVSDFISDGYNFIGVTDGVIGFGAAGSHDQTGTKAAERLVPSSAPFGTMAASPKPWRLYPAAR